MTIQEQIKDDLKKAMANKNESLKSLLRVVIGEFNRISKEVTNEEALSVIKKMHYNAVMHKNLAEAALLEAYIPKQLSEEDLRSIIEHLIQVNEFTSADMGKIMKELKAQYAGHYDGKMANELVKEVLAVA
jgi:uncharacterized protein YqeY